MELVLGERTTLAQRLLGRLGDLIEGVRRREPLLGGQPLDLPAELYAQLVVVTRDERAAVEREVVGRERVDGSAHDVRHHQVAPVDGLVVALPGDAVLARRQRQQSRISGEVGGRAGGRPGEIGRAGPGQPRAGEPEGEDLLGVHGGREASGRVPPSAETPAALSTAWVRAVVVAGPPSSPVRRPARSLRSLVSLACFAARSDTVCGQGCRRRGWARLLRCETGAHSSAQGGAR